MIRLIQILYGILFAICTVFSFMFFEQWNSNVLIPFFFLLALGTWLFGKTSGLLIILLIAIISMTLSQVYGDIYIYYSDRLTGAFLYMMIALLVGELRASYDRIKAINQELDRKVLLRDKELGLLTDQLLENAESMRMELGQELHDGIGQQLTGIQLLCSSLELHLATEKNKQSKLAASLASRSGEVHNHIRSIARTLFPIRIAHVGLHAALNELISCYSEIRSSYMTVRELKETGNMPETIALQFYRICQESCTYLLEHCSAEEIDITLNASEQNFIVGVKHDGDLARSNEFESLFGLIQYRLKKISGNISYSKTISGQSVIYFEVPKKPN